MIQKGTVPNCTALTRVVVGHFGGAPRRKGHKGEHAGARVLGRSEYASEMARRATVCGSKLKKGDPNLQVRFP